MFLLDLCLIIFIGFMLLYAIRLKPLEYLRTFIIYLAPILILYFFMQPVYHLMLKSKMFIAFSKMIKTRTAIIYYYLLKIILYFTIVFLLKLISYFTINRLINQQEKMNSKWTKRLINLPLAFIFGFIWSFWLIFSLTRLGIPYQTSYSHNLYQHFSSVSEPAIMMELNNNVDVFNELTKVESFIKLEKMAEINQQFDDIKIRAKQEIEDLKELLSVESINYLSTDVFDNIILLTGSDNVAQKIYETEAANKELRTIKQHIKAIEGYIFLAEAGKAALSANELATGFEIIISLTDNLSNNRKLNNELKQLVSLSKTQNDIILIAKEYFNLTSLDEAFINSLVVDYQRYLAFINHLSLNLSTDIINFKLLNKIKVEDNNESLKNEYFKVYLLKPLLKAFFKQGLTMVFPLVDDYLLSTSNDIKIFIATQVKNEFIKQNPNTNLSDYFNWIDKLPLSESSQIILKS